MTKFEYSLIIAVSFLAFNSCSNFKTIPSSENPEPKIEISSNNYGNYLAGRIAHYRQDFNTAADYYKKTAQNDTQNTALLNSTYLILASQGRIDEAAEYARLAQKQHNTNEFIPILIASEQFKKAHYQEAIASLQKNKSPLYKKLISPFFEAWGYTGLNDYKKAISALDKIKNEKGMEALYHFHSGMINDYFNKKDAARLHYEKIINSQEMELSIRSLEIICNFYLRSDNKAKATALAAQYNYDIPALGILKHIYKKTADADTKNIKPQIQTPQMGLSEAMFNIAAIIKQNPEAIDFSHIFIRLALYENPNNHLARILLGGILEMREMYKDAMTVYDEIPASEPSYYLAQYKKSENLRHLNDYKGAELLLKSLALDYPNDYQILLDLGDILRLQEKYKEALKYYQQALEKFGKKTDSLWQIHYAIGITYERLGEWEESEKSLIEALKRDPNNLLVLNYLGYSWLERNKKPEEAFNFIIQAYNQAPFNSSIIDSLGWAFYRFGMYDKAVTYLEKATDADPANAVINDHLGDAYWQSGRKNEARFQWHHALSVKHDSSEINRQKIKQKLANGLAAQVLPQYDKEKIQKIITKINE
ncbi:MAG: tetratricopeptide repeat protein [Alphaproteobacteria bacterium]|nr:tetratricopeptide repeat protein [Alphaproteobacteria bacterium]